MDLRQEWEDIPLRRLWVLVQGLPQEAATWREEVSDPMKDIPVTSDPVLIRAFLEGRAI